MTTQISAVIDTRITCPWCGVSTWMTDRRAFMLDHDRPDGRICRRSREEIQRVDAYLAAEERRLASLCSPEAHPYPPDWHIRTYQPTFRRDYPWAVHGYYDSGEQFSWHVPSIREWRYDMSHATLRLPVFQPCDGDARYSHIGGPCGPCNPVRSDALAHRGHWTVAP
jgi:hypothetical protein